MVSTNRLGLTILFGLVVFFFWRIRYPFALTYQEQFQLFLFDGDYFLGIVAEPGGLARYVAEFLVQFYNSIAIGATVLAILTMLFQRLTWRLMRCEAHYPLSFLPAVLLWYAMGDESVKLTYIVALLMAMVVMVMVGKIRVCKEGRACSVIRWGGIILLIPVLYWLIGPMVVLAALYVMPISVFVLGRLSGTSLADPLRTSIIILSAKKGDRQNHPGYARLFCKKSQTEPSLMIQPVFEK